MGNHRTPAVSRGQARRPAVPGLRFRRFRGTHDYAAIAALQSACNVADGIDEIPTADGLRADYEARTDIDPHRDFVIAELDGRVVGFGEMFRQLRDGVAIYWTFGSVLPE